MSFASISGSLLSCKDIVDPACIVYKRLLPDSQGCQIFCLHKAGAARKAESRPRMGPCYRNRRRQTSDFSEAEPS